MTVVVETTTAGRFTDVGRADIERIVHQASADNPIVIVTCDGRDGFAQAVIDETGMLVEHRAAAGQPMRSTRTTRAKAAEVLISWAFEGHVELEGIAWKTEKTEGVIDLRSACAIVEVGAGLWRCQLRGRADDSDLAADDHARLAPLWEIEAQGASADAAYTELKTVLAETTNRADQATRVAWGMWLGRHVRRLPAEQVAAMATGVSVEQQARIDATSRMAWPSA